jgi:4-hydroxybenzoate polyprenyltransferase
MKKIIAYLEVVRLHRVLQSTIPILLITVLLTRGFEGLTANWLEITQAVIFLGAIFYGGIYAQNNWADIEEDRRIGYKSNRPLATGVLSPNTGLIIAITHILGGLILIYLYAGFLFPYAIFLYVVNFLYTFVFKRYDRIFACFLLPLTQLARLAIGLHIADVWDPSLIWAFVSIFALMVAGHMQIQTTAGYLERDRYRNLQSFILVVSVLIGLLGYLYTANFLNLVPIPMSVGMLVLFRDWGKWEWVAKNVLRVAI